MKRAHWMLALCVLMGCLIAGCPTDDPVFGIEVGTAPRPDDIPPFPDTKLDSVPLQEIDSAEPPDSQDTMRPGDTVRLEDADVGCRSDDECLAELGPLSVCQVPLCEDGQCTVDGAPTGTECDDGNLCTLNDGCVAGECLGIPLDCDDKDDCTVDDCEPTTGICSSVVEDGLSCDDQDPCSGPDVCVDGLCTSTPTNCPPCGDDEDCANLDDEDACNGNFHCVEGVCAIDESTVVDCSVILVGPCEVASCLPSAGVCAINPKVNGLPCQVESECQVSGLCKEGVCLGDTIECNDGDPCTDDSCNPELGCSYIPGTGAECDDGSACTVIDTCIEGACIGALAVFCDDGESCTLDACESNDGTCVYEALEGDCDDGDACTAEDTCVEAQCVSKVPVDCDDGDACTTDTCHPKSGCLHQLLNCDDQNACTIDTCDSQQGCVSELPGTPCGSSSDCHDGLACTLDACNSCGYCQHEELSCTVGGGPCIGAECVEPSGCVVKLLSNLPCEDGDACTVDDQCFDGECVAGPSSCEPGTPDNPAESCLAIQTAKPDAGDGLYWLIAPAAEAVAFQVYCDMTTQGGGWSRVANIQGEVPVCSYSDGYGAESAVYQNEGTTGIMPLSIAGAIPFEGEILVRVAGVDYHFSSAHPAWSWSAVASGTITTLNVAAYQVQSAVNGVASGGVGYTSACTKIGSCLLGGAHAGTTDWGVVLGIGAYFTGTHKQDAACLTQSALKGLFTGPVAGGGGWGSTGQIYLR